MMSFVFSAQLYPTAFPLHSVSCWEKKTVKQSRHLSRRRQCDIFFSFTRLFLQINDSLWLILLTPHDLPVFSLYFPQFLLLSCANGPEITSGTFPSEFRCSAFHHETFHPAPSLSQTRHKKWNAYAVYKSRRSLRPRGYITPWGKSRPSTCQPRNQKLAPVSLSPRLRLFPLLWWTGRAQNLNSPCQQESVLSSETSCHKKPLTSSLLPFENSYPFIRTKLFFYFAALFLLLFCP